MIREVSLNFIFNPVGLRVSPDSDITNQLRICRMQHELGTN